MGIVKPHAYTHRKDIEYMILESGLAIPVVIDPYLMRPSIARLHYEAHMTRDFFPELIEMMTGGPTELMVVEGVNAIERLSDLTGPTDPRDAKPGTIRHRYGNKEGRIMYNAYHRSSSVKDGIREIFLHFDQEELREQLPESIRDLLTELL